MPNPWTKDYWSGYRRAQINALRRGLNFLFELEHNHEELMENPHYAKGYRDGLESLRKMLYKLVKKDAEINLNQE